MRVVPAMVFLVCALSVAASLADDNEKGSSAKSEERSSKTIVYAVRNAPADILSRTLVEFLTETGGRVVSDPISNVLLIQTAEENQERVLAMLQQLDRTPSTFRIHVYLLKAQGEASDALDTASLSDRTDEVLKSVESLTSTSRFRLVNRIELTAVENQPAFLQFGEDTPSPAATTAVPGRGASTSYRNATVGTMFKVQARLSDESEIVLEFDFEKSEIDPPTVVTEESSSAPQGTSRMTCQTTLRIRDGSSAMAGGMISQSNGTVNETYVVVSASIDKPEKTKQAANSTAFLRKPTSKAGAKPPMPAAAAQSIDSRLLAYYDKLLGKYDQNGDKVLDAEECSKMSKDCSEADTDKDGLVNVEELAIWSAKR